MGRDLLRSHDLLTLTHRSSSPALGRRRFLQMVAAVGAASFAPPVGLSADSPTTTPAARVPTQLARFPQKTDLILLTDRPPNLETPLRHFRHDLTPNEAF